MVSMTRDLQTAGCSAMYFTSESSMDQLWGGSIRLTFNFLVLPSVSMKTGSGIWEAKVLFPMPSGP